MARVTLSDPDNPTAKVNIIGIVDINKPGIYKLVYTVKDSATTTREITVMEKKTILLRKAIKSKSEDIYCDYSNLVINRNINSDNEMLSKDTPKEIIIKNSKENIVTSSNTITVNCYSPDKNNYSGYQVNNYLN